jgi:uncharacterized membrane protein YqjE
MEPGHTFSTLIAALKTDVKELVEAKLEIIRLDIFEKSSTLVSFLIFGLMIMNLVFFALLFAFIALGFLIGEWMHHLAGGFAVVTLIYLLLLILLIACRKSILTDFKNRILKELDPDLEDEARYEAKHARKH